MLPGSSNIYTLNMIEVQLSSKLSVCFVSGG